MSTKLFISKILLIIISIIILLYSLLLVKYDKWTLDLYYFIHLFNLFIAIDFVYFEINCSQDSGKIHYYFCTFPLTRFQILLLELKHYFLRWEFGVFILSILFFISSFYLLNQNSYYELFILIILYLIQVVYQIIIFFILKNFIKSKKITSDLKNVISTYISLMILIVVISDRSQFFKIILYINPVSNGFIAYLMGIQFGILGSLLSISLIIFLINIARIKFEVWDLY